MFSIFLPENFWISSAADLLYVGKGLFPISTRCIIFKYQLLGDMGVRNYNMSKKSLIKVVQFLTRPAIEPAPEAKALPLQYQGSLLGLVYM